MTSINPHYTFEYSQHKDYQFSHDSVFLARQVFELTEKIDLSHFNVLDLCSGCGIIGLDFLFHRSKNNLSTPLKTDFLEVQNIYKDHFNTNAARFKEITQCHSELEFINHNYEVLQNKEYEKKYHLILCNPPYFRPNHGVLSISEFKNRCRFFLDSDFENLIKSLENCSAPGAQIYILLNSLQQHNIDIEAEIKLMTSSFNIKKQGQIRRTDFWLLTKLN